MIFLILPVWWVPCVLVPILPVVSPWCLGGAPGEPPQRTHEFLTPKDDRVNSILNMKKTRFKSEVLFHILFRCLFIERDLLKTCAALRIYPSAKNPKKNMFHRKAIFNSNFHQVGCSRPLHVECPHGLLWEGINYTELAQEADSWAQTLTFKV